MRSNWTGAISLSLLSLPVKLGSSTKDNELSLHMIRASDGSRIRFTRVAETDGKEVPWDKTAKGYEAPDGSLVVLHKSDFEAAYGPKNRTASVLMFTDAATVPPMAGKKAYWVQPDRGGEKTYALLAGALAQTGKVAIITFAMRDRMSVAALRPYNGYLALEVLEWHMDMLQPDFAAPKQTASPEEQELALRLIEQMTGTYDHSAQKDPSSEALAAVIQAKIEAGNVIAAPPRPDSPSGATQTQDLMATLTAAVEAKRPAKAAPAPRRRTTARKSTTGRKTA